MLLKIYESFLSIVSLIFSTPVFPIEKPRYAFIVKVAILVANTNIAAPVIEFVKTDVTARINVIMTEKNSQCNIFFQIVQTFRYNLKIHHFLFLCLKTLFEECLF